MDDLGQKLDGDLWNELEMAGHGVDNWIVCTFYTLSALITAWRGANASQRCRLLDEPEQIGLTHFWP